MSAAGSVTSLVPSHESDPWLPRTSRTPVDVSTLGPQVGERVPGFSLKDHTGKTWTLPSVMGPKGATLVFFHSTDW